MTYKLLIANTKSEELNKLSAVLEKDFEIVTAMNMTEAFDMLEKLNIDIIFIDIQMNNFNVTKALQMIKDKHPNVIRIILGYSSQDKVVTDLIQKNLAKTCILPPWEQDISELANKIFKVENYLKQADLFVHIKNLHELPTIRSCYTHVVDLIDNDSDMDKIADAISTDPSMTSKLLRIVNSSYYGVRTSSVKHAITYLGTVNIRDLVLSTSVFDMFNKTDVPEALFQPLWKQSFSASKIVSATYRLMKKHISSYASLSGLMMNIGSVFLLNHFGVNYTRIIQMVKQQDRNNKIISLDSLEKKSFGITHQEIGGNLLNWWDIPYPFVEAALYHHDPFNENAIDKELMCVLHLAEHYSAKEIFMDCDINYVDKCFEYLNISKEAFEDKLLDIY